MVGVKYIASVSFGKDSTAMVLELIRRKYPLDYVVFYDTGMEFDAIYDVKEQVRRVIESAGIEFVTLKPKNPFMYDMLEREIHKRNGAVQHGFKWCGGACRWHTSSKIAAIKEFKKTLNDQVTDYVGITVDEPHRFEKSMQEGKVLPLVKWGMTEKDCLEYCYDKGFFWEQDGVRLYDILDRVSCWCCSNKNMKELRNIRKHLPRYWSMLCDLQAKIDIPFKGFYSDGRRKDLFDLDERFGKEEESQDKTIVSF